MLTESSEMYLQAVYRLTEKTSQTSIGAIARHMGFSLSTVSEKVRRLADEGFLRHEWREQVSLTGKGRLRALGTLRKRRLLETFLYEEAGYAIEELHEEACRLEHVISDRLADELNRLLGYPERDPHGHPVPTRDGSVADSDLASLAETGEGEEVMVAELGTSDPDLLKYAFGVGFIPGAPCRVLKKAPFRGPVTVEVGGTVEALSYEVAEIVGVQDLGKGVGKKTAEG
ncbi:metal-dependent transcriptional regulator [Chlorobium sp. N1]|uniref:metal-dependent transcriptional regulator n=1 Tax=Chlorobium sp. N1 TaxID=2491138 RepID=UPI00103A667C|nr:metal-dependent transcriptional regulator [Chlorobium sp. N1]TCD47370.1 metal-dependent transcriptional regulator [Chlorobium sp. N1]